MVGFPLLALVASFVSQTTTARRLHVAQQAVDQTQQARALLTSIMSRLLDSESRARAFVISKEENFLPRLNETKAAVAKELSELQTLVGPNAGQEAQVRRLRDQVKEKFGKMEEMVTDAEKGRRHRAAPDVLRENDAMEALHATSGEIDRVEAQREGERSANLARTRHDSARAAAVTLAVGLAAGGAAAWFFGRSIVRRLRRLQVSTRAVRQELPLLPIEGSQDEIGEVEKELEITSLVLAERIRKLRESENQLRAVIENTTAVVFLKDVESRFLLVNRRFEKIFSVERGAVLGKRTEDFFPREIAEPLRRNDLAVLKSGEAAEFEESMPVGGSLRTYLSLKVPLFDDLRKAYAICGIATDITGRERLVETAEPESAAAESGGTPEALAETSARLIDVQKGNIVGQVAGRMMRDFEKTLGAINGYASLLLEEAQLEKRETGPAEEILRASERAAELSRQLLEFTRAQPYAPALLDTGNLIQMAAWMLGPAVGETITLRTDVAADVGPIRADAGRIEQLLFNLVINARDAMPQGGPITIAARNEVVKKNDLEESGELGEMVAISVRDEGTGMSPEIQERIYEPFFTTKPAGLGSGLGLVTCAMIAEGNDGWLRCESEEGEGSTFTLFLPRAVEAAPPSGLPDVSPIPTGNETILIVDDNEGLAELTGLILRDLGYRVLNAPDGLAAEHLIAREERIDLVVTDLNMPRMSGSELARRLAQHHPGLRVLVISGDVEQFHRVQLSELAIELLPKPFSMQVLAQKVRRLLDSASSSET